VGVSLELNIAFFDSVRNVIYRAGKVEKGTSGSVLPFDLIFTSA